MPEVIYTIIADEFAVVPENMSAVSSGEDGVVDARAPNRSLGACLKVGSWMHEMRMAGVCNAAQADQGPA